MNIKLTTCLALIMISLGFSSHSASYPLFRDPFTRKISETRLVEKEIEFILEKMKNGEDLSGYYENGYWATPIEEARRLLMIERTELPLSWDLDPVSPQEINDLSRRLNNRTPRFDLADLTDSGKSFVDQLFDDKFSLGRIGLDYLKLPQIERYYVSGYIRDLALTPNNIFAKVLFGLASSTGKHTTVKLQLASIQKQYKIDLRPFINTKEFRKKLMRLSKQSKARRCVL